MKKKSLILVAGHEGLVGSALTSRLKKEGYKNLLLPSFRQLDLRDQERTKDFFAREKPEIVFMTAGRVGGIYANKAYPAEFIYDNILIASNIIHNSYRVGVKKLLFLGCACSYPRECPQPMRENYLLTGKIEETNYAYGIAKIAGLKMVQAYRDQYGCNFISAISANVYGPGDKYDLENSHVIPALIRKFCEAKEKGQKEVVLWGTGAPEREFLFSEDLAEALVFLMEKYDSAELINIGTGSGISIRELAEIIKEITGFKGSIIWDDSKPDGMPKKDLDVSRMNKICWKAKTELKKGLRKMKE